MEGAGRKTETSLGTGKPRVAGGRGLQSGWTPIRFAEMPDDTYEHCS